MRKLIYILITFLFYFHINAQVSFENEVTLLDHPTNLGAVNAVRIVDLNNDGNNDIISAFNSVIWNKNNGDFDFLPYQIISTTTSSFVRDLELKDLNLDGFVDVVCVADSRLEVYKNEGNEEFTLIYSIQLDNASKEVEIGDIDNNDFPDILFTSINGSIKVGIIKNFGDFNFDTIISLDYQEYGYKPNRIRCADIDNDGDNDIVVSSREYSRIQLLKNEGNGNFQFQLIMQSITTDPLTLKDVNNDNNLDIISGGYYIGNKQIYWIENENGNFNTKHPIDDNKGVTAISLEDIDNNGFEDLICAYYNDEGATDDELFCYLNYESGFGNMQMLDYVENGFSLSRDVYVSDLNNDQKLDIVTSYYYNYRVGYFENISDIPTPIISDTNEDQISNIYPNPTDDIISWKSPYSKKYQITIYNCIGGVVYSFENYKLNSIDLTFLSEGIYFIEFTDNKRVTTKKIIKY